MRSDPPFVTIRPRTRRLGHVIVHKAETESTMADARERALAGAAEGLVVVADRQTNGVGRRGRAWVTVGSSLHATLLLRPTVDAERLQLVALATGVALADAIRRLTKVEARLKWPNDVLVGDRKLGGVLVDAVYGGQGPPSFMLVGVGVNGDARSEEFPPDLAGATSLSLAAGRHVCLPALLKLFLEAFEARYDALAAGRTEGVWSEARRLLETLGRRVRVQTETGPVVGDAIDLGPGGELLVRMPGTVLAVRSGECEELRNA